jgi:hypothetical protein
MGNEIKFDLSPEDEEYLRGELSDFFRGFIFFNARNMADPVIEKLRSQALYADDEITVTYTVGINRNLIIAMLGKRLPYPPKPGKRLVDYLEKSGLKRLLKWKGE